MKRLSKLLLLTVLAACGGGGGGTSVTPSSSDAGASPAQGAVIVGAQGTEGQTSAGQASSGAPSAAGSAGTAGATGTTSGGGATGSAGGNVAVALPAPSLNPAGAPAYLHILSTGQSLALGETSRPSRSNTQPYGNLMLSPGLQGTAGPFKPLIENDGTDLNKESPSAGMANGLRAADPQARPVVVGLHAQSGVPYAYLKKGGFGTAFATGIAQATLTKSLVEKAGGFYQPIGVTVVHGESDYAGQSGAKYEDYLKEWQNDYQTDVNALTGSTAILPMFISQMNTGATGEIPVAQYRAHKNNPGKIVLVGPKYQYDYGPDRMHLTNIQSRHLGELFAKVIKQVALDGKPWQPLMPKSVQRDGRLVTIDFLIPVGTLKLDTTTVALRPNYGFDFVQTGGTATVGIQSVALTDGDTRIQITLSAVPDGTDQKIRYAWRCNGGGLSYQACGKASDGAHVGGNIRDSDLSVSPASDSTGLPLHNWLVTFEESVANASSGAAAGGTGSSASGASPPPASVTPVAPAATTTPPAPAAPAAGTSTAVPVLSSGTPIAAWGDSLTAGSGGIPYPTQLAEFAPARTIFNGGVPGQNAQQIIGRQGSLPVRATVLGGRLPASGAVDFSAISIAMIDISFSGPVYGTLAGVYGRLEKSPAGYPASFVRDQPGPEVAVAPDTVFVVDQQGRNAWINVFWVGRNGFLTSATEVQSAIASAVASLSPPRRFIVMSVLNAWSEPRGSPYYQIITQLNADLARQYPDNFIDIRSYLISRYDPTVAQDIADVGNDTLPSTLHVDGLHLNTKGYGVVARRVAEFIAAKGW